MTPLLQTAYMNWITSPEAIIILVLIFAVGARSKRSLTLAGLLVAVIGGYLGLVWFGVMETVVPVRADEFLGAYIQTVLFMGSQLLTLLCALGLGAVLRRFFFGSNASKVDVSKSEAST